MGNGVGAGVWEAAKCMFPCRGAAAEGLNFGAGPGAGAVLGAGDVLGAAEEGVRSVSGTVSWPGVAGISTSGGATCFGAPDGSVADEAGARSAGLGGGLADLGGRLACGGLTLPALLQCPLRIFQGELELVVFILQQTHLTFQERDLRICTAAGQNDRCAEHQPGPGFHLALPHQSGC